MGSWTGFSFGGPTSWEREQAEKAAGPSQADLAAAKLEKEKEFQNKQAQENYIGAIRQSSRGYGGAGQSQTQPSNYGSYGSSSGRNQTLG